MGEMIRVLIVVTVIAVNFIAMTELSTFSRSAKYIKEDMEIAVHDAALQLNTAELAQGQIVFNEGKALDTFHETFQLNSGMNEGDYEVIEFIVMDDSNSIFPEIYVHPVYGFEDIVMGPSVIALVESSSDQYFKTRSNTIRRVASYTYTFN
ncbi:hypothetical protein AB3N04_00825 (plasmid) [Alkalihalophilus sp. As8PL]|uniref:Uncharacterized protein n=1 Tax=Alkalihalophilus sp. As8PL TaxID=3237103 RepID=A0AB39BML3_9BACI